MSVACNSPSLVSVSRSATEDAAVIAASRRNVVHLQAGHAASLRAECARILQVSQGKLWITPDATARRATEDVVLGVGQSLRVAAGDRIVIEPWDAGGATYMWNIASTSA
ncbi:MAG: DUF2917 domain-containing protein [Janthinobacterium lividum]